MKDTRVVLDASGTILLCETFTDDESKVLQQVDTGIVYGRSAIDIIEGYYDDTGKPYSRFTYEEIDKPDNQEESDDPIEQVVEQTEP